MVHLEKRKVYATHEVDRVELINFPFGSSLKIIPIFEKISPSDRSLVKERIDEICKIELWAEDTLGMLLVDVVYLFMQDVDMVIVNTAGLSEQSILFLEEKLPLIADKLHKVAVINRNRLAKLL